MEVTEEFWQGYACAMEILEYKLEQLTPSPSDELIPYVKEEIAKADKKIADLR